MIRNGTALNHVGAYHHLRRTINRVNGDKFRGHSEEEIESWDECARLMANAIIYLNSNVLRELRASGQRQAG